MFLFEHCIVVFIVMVHFIAGYLLNDPTNNIIQVQRGSSCRQKFINQSFGILTSPFYPLGYPDNTRCEWIIDMDKNSRVVLIIKSFVLGPGDELVITDKSDLKFSLDNPPNDVIFSQSNKMSIKLISTSIIDEEQRDSKLTIPNLHQNRSFYAEFEKEGCGGFLTANSGYITIPSYIHHSRIPHNCAWTIVSPSNKVIVLQFLQFDLPPGSCLYSNIYIREGNQTAGYVLGDFCEENPPFNILRTSSNIMYIDFRTRRNLLFSNIQMNPMIKMYYKVEDTCGGKLSGYSGSFATPRRWLDDVFICNWNINVPQEKQMLVKFDSWYVKGATKTEYDEIYLIIPSSNYVFWRSNGELSPPDSILIPSNQLVVSLRSYRNLTASVKLNLHGIYQAININDKQCINVGHKRLFMCDDWRYIDCSQRCDGVIDCENALDERLCPITSLDAIVMQHLRNREESKSSSTFLVVIFFGIITLLLAFILTITKTCRRKKSENKHVPERLTRGCFPPPYSPIAGVRSQDIPPPPYSETDKQDNITRHKLSRKRKGTNSSNGSRSANSINLHCTSITSPLEFSMGNIPINNSNLAEAVVVQNKEGNKLANNSETSNTSVSGSIDSLQSSGTESSLHEGKYDDVAVENDTMKFANVSSNSTAYNSVNGMKGEGVFHSSYSRDINLFNWNQSKEVKEECEKYASIGFQSIHNEMDEVSQQLFDAANNVVMATVVSKDSLAQVRTAKINRTSEGDKLEKEEVKASAFSKHCEKQSPGLSCTTTMALTRGEENEFLNDLQCTEMFHDTDILESSGLYTLSSTDNTPNKCKKQYDMHNTLSATALSNSFNLPLYEEEKFNSGEGSSLANSETFLSENKKSGVKGTNENHCRLSLPNMVDKVNKIQRANSL